MCPATVENAIFFLDAFLASTMESGKELAVADFQVSKILYYSTLDAAAYGDLPHLLRPCS
jgi:hypothetical protein